MRGNDKALPRPWVRDEYGHVKDADGNSVALTNFSLATGHVGEVPRANDEFVFLAANAHDALRDVVEALVLFYDAPHWTPEKAARWEELTGATEATTRVLADSARVALGMVHGFCPVEGCLVVESHYHRETRDGEEIVKR